MTSQRQAILAALDELDSHPSAEELYEIVRQQDASINLSTVYRTLRWLEQENLVRSRWFDAPDSSHGTRFDKALPVEHHHFVCTCCGAVLEFDTPLAEVIKAGFEQDHQVQVSQSTITLYGLCRNCHSDTGAR
jgi:Fe2+ or Zn2+ uptake regulation protein